MTVNLQDVVETLSSLTVLEASELSKMLEEKWGVSASAPVAAMAMAPAAAAEVVVQTEFDVILTEMGANKLNVIKAVRELNSAISLPDAKALVESAPKPIKQGVSKEEAEKAKQVLEAAGAKVELK